VFVEELESDEPNLMFESTEGVCVGWDSTIVDVPSFA
jgi:hypothetical protein